MKKILVLVFLCAALASSFAPPTAAQTGQEPPLCGIGHMDYETGEFVCDDPDGGAQVNGIGHMDAPAADTTAATVVSTLLDVAAVIVSVTGH